MVAFVTLFIGLVLGPQDVEVIVGDDVARVEIVLNGEVAAVLKPAPGEPAPEEPAPEEDAPWRTRVDLGSELAPGELLAVAYDARGTEVARARQWVNMPQDPAVSRWVLEGGAEDAATAGRPVRLTWESTTGDEPEAVRISFDGRLLDGAAPGGFLLPPHDPDQLHFLRAELDFGDNVVSVAEMTFGGTYGDEITTEMTAVPITVSGGSPPTVGSLAGRLRKNGEPLEVLAVEQESATVILVVDRNFGREMEAIRERNREVARTGSLEYWRFAAQLRPGQRLRFVLPVAEERPGRRSSYDLFATTPGYAPGDAGVYYLLEDLFRNDDGRGEQRLADAVAVAGMTAAGLRRPRRVILVLGRGPEDRSQLSPGLARGYLERLRVPLEVWGTRKKPTEATRSWGERFTDVSTMGKLEGAVRQLGRELEDQWIVWVEGVHLPQEVELADGGGKARLLP